MKNEKKKFSFGEKITLLLLLILSTFAVSCYALGIIFPKAEPMPGKDTLIANIENCTAVCDTVNDYLVSFGFSNYNKQKLIISEISVEEYYYDKTVFEDKRALAVNCANIFIEHLYDRTDLNDRTAVTDAILSSYVEALGDRYSTYRTSELYDSYNEDISGEFVGIGVSVIYDYTEMSIYVSEAIVDSPAQRAGIRGGDYIVAVDGKRVSESDYNDIIAAIRGEVGTSVRVTVLRGEDEITFEIIRERIVETTVSYELMDNGIGYIRITGFKDNTDEQFIEALSALENQNATSIIFDLRGNPGGTLDSVTNMISYLVPNGTVIASFSAYKDTVYANEEVDHSLSLPSVVICNENTASAGELFTSALRDYDDMGLLECTTVGTTTFGKGIMQSSLPFTDHSAITLTVAFYNPPSGVNYHNIGITPDFTVELDVESESDAQLEYALSYLNSDN